MKNNYKINFAANTITITKRFEDAANNPNSEEFQLLRQILADYPTMKILHHTRRAPQKCRPTKRLTYANMEKYMSVFENAAELLEQFETVQRLSKTQPSPYAYVVEWFTKQFPKYKELPDFKGNSPKVTILPAPLTREEKAASAESDKVA